jgi:hypothetical protein
MFAILSINTAKIRYFNLNLTGTKRKISHYESINFSNLSMKPICSFVTFLGGYFARYLLTSMMGDYTYTSFLVL